MNSFPEKHGLHTLLDSNESSLDAVTFRKRIDEPFQWSRNKLFGKYRVVSGALFLEMVRAACAHAGNDAVVELAEISWLQPLIVQKFPLDLYVDLYPGMDSTGFEIYTSVEGEKTSFCRGLAKFARQAPQTTDHQLTNIQAIIKRTGPPITGRSFYRKCKSIGYQVDKSLQVISEAHFGEDEVLIRFKRSQAPEDTHIPPDFLDGVLVATAFMDPPKLYGMPFPFSLQKLNLEATSQSVSHAWLRTEQNEGQVACHISLCNKDGTLIAVLCGLFLRAVNEKGEFSPLLRYFSPAWKPALLSSAVAGPETLVVLDGKAEIAERLRSLHPRVIFVEPAKKFAVVDPTHYRINPINAEDYRRLFSSLLDRGAVPDGFLHLLNRHQTPALRSEDPAVAHKSLSRNLDRGLLTVVYIYQAIKELDLKTPMRCLYVYSGIHRPSHESVSAFGRTLLNSSRLLELNTCSIGGLSLDTLGDFVFRELCAPSPFGGLEIRFTERGREVKTFHSVPGLQEDPAHPDFVRDGVYLISGGEAGFSLAQHLAENYPVKLGLVLPDSLNFNIRKRFKRFIEKGHLSVFAGFDLSCPSSTAELVKDVGERLGSLNGIFHTMGNPLEREPLKLPGSGFEKSQWPNVSAVINLDTAFAHEDLDSFIIFSSLTAVVGDTFPSLQSAAYRFLDGFSSFRNALVREGRRKGRTLSLNWPFLPDSGPGAENAGSQELQFMDKAVFGSVFQAAQGSSKSQLVAAFSRDLKLFPFHVSVLSDAPNIENSRRVRSFPRKPFWDLEHQDIAVVGMAGRYPQSPDLNSFWDKLASGDSCLSDIPLSRWEPGSYGSGRVNLLERGGYLDDVDKFDANFFKISHIKAMSLDPQGRLLMEVTWEAMEHAGHTRASMGRDTGVFIGCRTTHYGLLSTDSRSNEADQAAPATDYISGFFGFQGPGIVVDVGEVSSTTALHLACESLRRGDCKAAIAGGAHLDLFLDPVERSGKNEFHSGEGVGVVVLKPVSSARLDGDSIYGVIKGSALGHSPQISKNGRFQFSVQADSTKKALRNAKVDPGTVGYIETTGDGACSQDQGEIKSLASVYGSTRGPLPIGAMAPGLGRLGAATGVCQLTRVLLQMHHGVFVPVVQAPSLAKLEVDGAPFYFPKPGSCWEVRGDRFPRRAALSSVGSHGSYGHMIVEEDTSPQRLPESRRGASLFVFSAISEKQLKEIVARMVDWLDAVPEPRLWDVSFTLAVGREAMAHRLAVKAASAGDFLNKLRLWLRNSSADGVWMGDGTRNRELCYLVEGPSGSVMVRDLFKIKDLERLARLWTAGACLDMADMFAEQIKSGEVKRVALPTYPFSRTRYWLEGDRASNDAPSQEIGMQSESSASAGEPAPMVAVGQEPDLSSEPQLFLEKFQKELMELASPADQSVPQIASAFGEILKPQRQTSRNEEYPQPVYGRKPARVPAPEVLELGDPLILPDEFGLSFGQRALLDSGDKMGALSIQFRLKPETDWEMLRLALQIFYRRRAVLSTVVRSRKGSFYHKSNVCNDLSIFEEDCSLLRTRDLDKRIRVLTSQKLNLKKGPLMRVFLLHGSALERVLLIHVHEIVCDERSMMILASEVNHIYECMIQGTSLQLKAIEASYADFVNWQQALLVNGQRHKAFWDDFLSKPIPSLSLPAHLGDVAQSERVMGSHMFPLDDFLLKKLTGFARHRNANLFALLLTAYFILLYRYSGATELLVGARYAGRPESKFKNVFGRFADILPLRSRISESPGFHVYLTRVQAMVDEAQDHACYPVHDLLLDPAAIKVNFLFRDQAASNQASGGEHGFYQSLVFVDRSASRSLGDLNLEIVLGRTGNTACFEYRQGLFDKAIVARMANHFKILLESILAEPKAAIDNLPVLTEEEKLRLLLANNDTRSDNPAGQELLGRIQGTMKPGFGHAAAVKALASLKRDLMIHELFQLQSELRSYDLAIQDHGRKVTYAQLNSSANILGRQLVDSGVGWEKVVAIFSTHVTETLVGILAVFKAGGAVTLPDCNQPTKQVAQLLSSAKVQAVMCSEQMEPLVSEAIALIPVKPVIHKLRIMGTDEDVENLPYSYQPNGLAILNYAGEEAALLTCEGISNGMHARVRDMKLTPSDRVLRGDGADDTQMFMWFDVLISGGQLHVFDEETFKQPQALLDESVKRGVTVFDLQSETLKALAQADLPSWDLKSLRWVMVNAIPDVSLVASWLARYPSIPISTAFSIPACAGPLAHDFNEEPPEANQVAAPAGYPVTNTCFYLLNKRLKLYPDGFSGEIHVAGQGLARGYLNNTAKTAQAFIPNHFGPPGSRMLKTGRIGVWDSNGKLRVLNDMERNVGSTATVIQELTDDQKLSTCPALIGEQFELRGASPSVSYIGEDGPLYSMDYADLDQASDALAHLLVCEGVGIETPVGVCIEPTSQYLVAAVIAALKAGGHFLLLNPEESKERLFPAIIHSGCAFVLSSNRLVEKVQTPKNKVVDVDKDVDVIGDPFPRLLVHAENSAWLSYGKDQWGGFAAVVQTHEGLFQKAAWAGQTLALTSSDRILSPPNLAEEACLSTLFSTLCVGASVLFYGDIEARSLIERAGELGVTVLVLTDGHQEDLRKILPHLEPPQSLRMIVTTGADPLTWSRSTEHWMKQVKLSPAPIEPEY